MGGFRRKKKVDIEQEVSSGAFKSRRNVSSKSANSSRNSRYESRVKTSSVESGASWRPNQSINNLEQEKKREVEKEIKEKNKLRRRRRNARVTLKLAIFGLVFVGIYIALCMVSKRVEYGDSLQSVNVYSESMEKEAQKAVSGGIIGNIKPSFSRYDEIRTSIIKDNPEVDSVAVKFNFWKMRTDVKLKIETPIISWKISEDKTAYVNEKGEVFEPPLSLVELFKPLEIAGTGLGATSNQAIPVNNDKLGWIVAVVPEIRNGGVEASKVNVAGETLKNVEVELAAGNIRLIFSTEEDPVRSGVAAAKSVKYLERSRQGGLEGISYIDVSNPDRVVYK